jgi:hypothetical protein
MTDSGTNNPATTPGSQTADTTTQFNKKSGKGNRDGVISELATFYEIIPGHEEECRAACERLANTLKSAPRELNIETGLRDERHVIFDGGKRLMWCTTFETDWDPYVEDAILRIGIENFIDWLQHTKEWPKFEAWLREAGGVEALNRGKSDPTVEKSARMSTRGLKEFLQGQQEAACGYYNAVSYVTHRQIARALQVEQAFEQVLDSPGAAQALQNPALKPLADLAAD